MLKGVASPPLAWRIGNREGKKLDSRLSARGGAYSRQVKIFFIICCLLSTIYCPLPSAFAEINNTIAYSISNTSTPTANRLGTVGSFTIAQKVYSTVEETWYGIVVYLDRNGFASSTDSVKLRFRAGTDDYSPCPSAPDTSLLPKRDVYIKVLDIPDGDAENATMPPDSIARGYAIWFIFDTPISVSTDQCFTIFLNGPYTDASNRINWFYGTNSYSGGSCWYQTTGAWTDYGFDMGFRVIKDKYALAQVRRLPFNTRGVLTINSDIDNSSVDYLDSLHRWMNTSQDVGGSWGQGLNGQIAGNDLWFGRGPLADSLGVYSKDVPFYFHGLDTTSNFYKDTVDNYISRRWADGNHSYADCGWDGADATCMDSTHVKKFLNYMLNRPTTFSKLYKAGLFINHGSQLINFGTAGSTGALGDSSGTVYYHANKTCAAGRFKFVWNSNLTDPDTSLAQKLNYNVWQAKWDSLNIAEIPILDKTFRDGTKFYEYLRVGRGPASRPDSLYKFFNRTVAKNCSDSTWISVVHCHLGYLEGLDQDDRDSIKAVYDSVSAWKLWMPSTKALFNQQTASAFAQITIDRPSGSKRRINIRSLYDWNWGSHVPDREEIYYLTLIAYAPESLIVTINASDTLPDSNMVSQQDVATGYLASGSTSQGLRAMSWVGMYNQTAGRKIIVYPSEAEAPPTGKRNRTAVIKQLLESNK
ncbi:MAG: hypothetical protein V1890_00060 [Candidatus Zixiibacteriota bacterium]